MQAAEIELKFSVDDPEALRAGAERAGFRLVTPRTFESNTLYDTPERRLLGMKQILRLRQYGERWVVTHKRQPSGADDVRYKTRIETESEVEDGPALEEIFAQLGYRPMFRYEKFRTEYATDEGHLLLDETPIGVWAELEGPPEWIETVVERLGIGAERCTTLSYGKLFLTWKNETGSSAENLTFDEVGAGALAGTR